MKKIILALSMIALLGLYLGNGAVAVAQDEVAVSINTPAEVVVGSDFTVTVDIHNVTDFDAGLFDVTFNSSVLQLDSVTKGLIGDTEIPISLWVEMSPGVYRVLVNVPGFPGVSGSGYLAVLHFHMVGSAGSSSALDLSHGGINNNLGEMIPSTWIGGSVTACEQLVITTAFLPDGAVGDAYSASLQATGGNGSYTWSISSGGLPDGITLSSAGQISGVPTTGGNLNFTIEVTDGTLSESKEYYITITMVISPGDANQDGKINTADITTIERIIIGLEDTNTGTDTNQDGRINTADLTTIEMVILGLF